MFDNNLLALLQLADATLPIGGYAHSSGLETYVQKGIVKDLPSARQFVTGMLSFSMQHTDAAFVSLAFDAAAENNTERLLQLDQECTAVKLPAEMRQSSQKLGMRLLKIFTPLLTECITRSYLDAVKAGKAHGHYSIAFGACAAVLKIPKAAALTGFFYNAASSMITNCVKLIPLGQQDGQELLFSLHPLIQQLVTGALQPDPALLGLCNPGFDMRSMQHEQLYSRLYMS